MALTLRLDENEQATLETIKSTMGVKTASAALKQMITEYQSMRERIDTLNNYWQSESQQRTALQTQMQQYFDAQYALAKMVGRVPNQETIDALNTPDDQLNRVSSLAELRDTIDADDRVHQ